MNAVKSAVDLTTATTVRELVHPLAPVASVYLGLTAADPAADAEEDLLLRWRAIESRLAGQGADRATIDTVGSLVARTLPDEVIADGAGPVLAGRLVDVAVRAALLTDAEVWIVDKPLPEGVGAICRFDLAG
jgi:hypothetical protein